MPLTHLRDCSGCAFERARRDRTRVARPRRGGDWLLRTDRGAPSMARERAVAPQLRITISDSGARRTELHGRESRMRDGALAWLAARCAPRRRGTWLQPTKGRRLRSRSSTRRWVRFRAQYRTSAPGHRACSCAHEPLEGAAARRSRVAMRSRGRCIRLSGGKGRSQSNDDAASCSPSKRHDIGGDEAQVRCAESGVSPPGHGCSALLPNSASMSAGASFQSPRPISPSS